MNAGDIPKDYWRLTSNSENIDKADIDETKEYYIFNVALNNQVLTIENREGSYLKYETFAEKTPDVRQRWRFHKVGKKGYRIQPADNKGLTLTRPVQPWHKLARKCK